MIPREQLPSGKVILRKFDSEGRLTSEMHAYGLVDIALTVDYLKGEMVSEAYIVKNRLVSRRRYEQVRERYSDMPAANLLLEDPFHDLNTALAQERRDRQKAAKARQPDLENGRKIDAFCTSLMEQGTKEAAGDWIKAPGHTLGELSHARSLTLVAKLFRLGCKQIHACKIDDYAGLGSNTGHVVVELPEEPGPRKAVLRELDRLATRQGYSGDFDDGQHYGYVKLD